MNAKRWILIKVLIVTTLTACAAVAQGRGISDATATIKEEILKNWEVALVPERGAYELRSPAYAMEHDDGCVRYIQIYTTLRSEISFSDVEFEVLYSANVSGKACSTVRPESFFRIEGDNVDGALDFVRKVYAGVSIGRDKFERHELPRLESCLSVANRDRLWVFKAGSELQGGTMSQDFHLVLRCPSLSDADEILVSGSEDNDQVVWKVVASQPLDVN